MVSKPRTYFAIALLLGLVLVHQGCSKVRQNSNTQSETAQSLAGNGQGYGGKVYVHVGTCGQQEVAIVARMEISQDESIGLMDRENCTDLAQTKMVPASEITFLPKSESFLYQSQAFRPAPTPNATADEVKELSLRAFITRVHLAAHNRLPTAADFAKRTGNYATRCEVIILEEGGNQESHAIQQSLPDVERMRMIGRINWDRDLTDAEVQYYLAMVPTTNWYEGLYINLRQHQNTYDRCAAYNLNY